MSRVNQLDVLRGLALFGVIVVHTSQSFQSFSWRIDNLDVYYLGRYGVQLFFVVSGFVMMMMYESYEKTWSQPHQAFYIKRVMRIVPLFVFAAIAYLPITMNGGFAYFHPDGVDLAKVLRVVTFTGGVDPHLLNAVVPGGWSIVNEIYFYLVFPLLVILIRRNMALLIGVVIALLNYVLLANADTLFAGREPYLIADFLYRNFITQAIVFMAGIGAFYFVHGTRRWMFAWCAAPVLAAGVLLEFVDPRAQLLKTTLLAIAFFAVVIATFELAKAWPKLMEARASKLVARFGTITYSGYIIHFGVIYLAKKATDALDAGQYLTTEVMIIFVTIITAAIALST
ncbi:MAG: acyltransferase, partial [Pseudomonadota bacterium]